MIRWRVLVPIKQGGNGKSRLAAELCQVERDALSLHMAQHVLGELARCCAIDSIEILSPTRPDWWSGAWVVDTGRGLNAEITAWRNRCGDCPVLIIHADLPLLRAQDVAELLDAATAAGIALATDRAGQGSNAIAISDGRPFAFRFGADSRPLHAQQCRSMPVIQSIGLSTDIDTPEDLKFAHSRGLGELV